MTPSPNSLSKTSQQRPRAAALRLIAAAAAVIGMAWTSVAVYAVHAALPHNVLQLPMEHKLAPQLFLPEGWAFFTRNPREDRYIVYRLAAGGKWIDTNLGPHNRASNALGMNRKSRAQGVEVGLLLNSIDAGDWKSCRQSPIICLTGTSVSLDFKDISPRPTLCGEVGLVLQPPVPWAWSRLPRPVIMPSRVSRVRVHC